MKILIVTAWYPTRKNPISGIFVKEIAKALSKCADVSILHVLGDPSIKGLYEISEWTDDGIRVIRVRYRRLPVLTPLIYMATSIRISRYVFKKIKPDIVHLHVYRAGIPALIMKKFFKVPYVATEHYKLLDGDGLVKRALKKFFASLILNSSELLVLPSKTMLEELRSHGIFKDTVIVPNAVNTEIFEPHNMKNDSKRILFVGGLEEIKGVDYLLKAIRIVAERRKDFVLDVIGDGIDRWKYEKLASDLDVSDLVEFHGLKTKEEVAEFMKRCSFLVLPSIWESQSCVLIEALACGKPVIATSSGGPREFVQDFCGVLVPPKDSETLAEAIDFMLDNYDKYDSNKISQYVESIFGYDVVGRRLREIYELIL